MNLPRSEAAMTVRLAVFLPAGPVPSWVVRLVGDCLDLPDVRLVALLRDASPLPAADATVPPASQIELQFSEKVMPPSSINGGGASWDRSSNSALLRMRRSQEWPAMTVPISCTWRASRGAGSDV